MAGDGCGVEEGADWCVGVVGWWLVGVVVGGGEWSGWWLAGMMAAKDFEKRGGKTKVRLFRADASRTTLAY